jgi:hypothetical protein
MRFKDAKPFITTSVFGAAFLVTALTCAARNNGVDAVMVDRQTCIQDQFSANGYRIISSGPDAVGLRITGQRENAPLVTIFSQKGAPPEIRLGDAGGRFALQESAPLGVAQNLAEGISKRCFGPANAARARVLSAAGLT